MAKVHYFAIGWGLRGCYIPDGGYIAKVTTRRELRDTLLSEADALKTEDTVGLGKAAVTALACAAWRAKSRATLDFVAPYKSRRQSMYASGLFCSTATKSDYLAQSEMDF